MILLRNVKTVTLLWILALMGTAPAVPSQTCIQKKLSPGVSEFEIQENAYGPRVFWRNPHPTQSIDEIQQLRVGQYNILNYLQKKGKFVRDPNKRGVPGPIKSVKKIRLITRWWR